MRAVRKAIGLFALLLSASPLCTQPRINSGGVVGGGLTGVRQISPGGIVSIFGTGLAPAAQSVGAADLDNGRLPARLGGVCVEAGGEQGRLFFVSPNQINFQAPGVVSGSVAVSVVANCGQAGENRSNAETVTAQTAAPEFFSYLQNSDGRNPIAAIHSVTNARLGSPSLAQRLPGVTFQPARPGDFVTLFATGLGATNPPFAVGVLPDGGAPVTQKVSVLLNGIALADSDILYAGVAPGLAGLYQVNIRIPATAPDGDVAIVVRAGSASSPAGAYLTIRNPQGGGPAPDAVSAIEVAATQNYVLAARTLPLQARATTSFGATISGFLPQWESGAPAVATVDSQGLVRGVSPGNAEIRAVSPNGVTGRLTIRVYPGRIDIQPAALDLRVGGTATLVARALDADGKLLAGMRFQWFAGLSSIATVDVSGKVTAAGEGSTAITARLDLGITGFDFSAPATVTVRRQPDYRISAMISSDLVTSNVTLRNIYATAFAGTDTVALLADLSNGSRALLLHRGGAVQTLAVSGQYLEAIGQTLYNLRSVSVNSAGDVLAFAEFLGDGCRQAVVIFPVGQPPTTVVGGCNVSGAPPVVAENRDIYYVANSNRTQDLMLRKADGQVQKILNSADASLGRGQDSGINSLALSGSTLIFQIGSPSGWTWFAREGSTSRRIYAFNDNLGGRFIQWGNAPWAGQAGEYYATVGGQDFNWVVRFAGGSAFPTLTGGEVFDGVTVFNSEYLMHARGSDLLAQVNTDQGRQIARFTRSTSGGITARFLGRIDNSIPARNGYLTAAGDALVQFGVGGAGIVRYGGSVPTTLVSQTRALGSPANFSVFWDQLARTSTASSPIFRSFSSLLRVTGGSAQALLTAGGTLVGSALLDSLGNVAAARNGDLAFCANTDRGSHLYLYRGGRLSLLVEPHSADGSFFTTGSREIDWIPCWENVVVAVNNRGQVAAYAGVQGYNELTLFTEGSRTAQLIARELSLAPGGGTYQYIDSAAVDEAGRVLYSANLTDGSRGLYLFENGLARRILHQSGNAPSGARFNDARELQANGNKFYALLGDEQGREIAEFDGSKWRTLTRETNGSPIGLDRGRFAVSSNGDILYLASAPDGRQVRALRADGRDLVIAKSSERTPDGDWILSFLDVVSSDRSDVFFSANTQRAGANEKVTIFQAVPQ